MRRAIIPHASGIVLKKRMFSMYLEAVFADLKHHFNHVLRSLLNLRFVQNVAKPLEDAWRHKQNAWHNHIFYDDINIVCWNKQLLADSHNVKFHVIELNIAEALIAEAKTDYRGCVRMVGYSLLTDDGFRWDGSQLLAYFLQKGDCHLYRVVTGVL